MAKAREVSKFAFQHLRNGYIGLCPVMDFVLIGFIAVDIFRYNRMGLSLLVPLSYFYGYDKATYLLFFNALVYVLVILPIVISFVRAILNSDLHVHEWIGTRTKSSTYAHISLSVTFALLAVLSMFMEKASGVMGLQAGTYAFNSLTLDLFRRIIMPPWGFLLVLAAPTILIHVVNVAFSWRTRKLPSWLRDYVARVRLQDLGGDCYPTHGRIQMNFNMAVAPEIAFIRKRANVYFRKYQKLRPGSQEAAGHLNQLLNNSRTLLNKLFFPGIHPDGLSIEFFPGTGRAIEVALQRIENLNTIILSPFEHYCLDAIGSWLHTTRSISVKKIRFDPEFLYLSWAQQEKKIVSEFVSAINTEKQSSAIVVSEVISDSGVKIPVSQLFQKIVKELNGANDLTLIIDGAHGLGNVKSVDIGPPSALYVSSAHKWLFSPEPCGILVRQSPEEIRTYDSWNSSLPVSTSSANMIAGLYAALEFIDLESIERLRERSIMLKERFVTKIRQAKCPVDIIGHSHTNMIAVYPSGSEWKMGEDVPSIQTYFDKERTSTNVLVVNPHKGKPWVRVSFPYFLEGREVENLVSKIACALK